MTSTRPSLGDPFKEPESQSERATNLRKSCPPSASRVAFRVFASFVLGTVALLAYLTFVGFPQVVTDRWAKFLESSSVRVEIGKVRLDFFLGAATIEHLRLFGEADLDYEPLVEISSLVVRVDLLAWLSGRSGLRSLQIRDASVRMAIRETREGPVEDSIHLLRSGRASLTFDPTHILIDALRGSLLRTRLKGEGFVLRSARPETAARSVLSSWMTFLQPVTGGRRLAWLDFVKELRGTTFPRAPDLTVEFTVNREDPLDSKISLAVEATETTLRGISFDRWSLEVVMKDRVLHVPSFGAHAGERQVQISGSLGLDERVVEARVFNDLPTSYWTSLVPLHWRTQWVEGGVLFSGSVSCEMWIGPSTLREVGDRLSGWVAFNRTDLKGIWFEKAFTSFRKMGEVLRLTNIDALLGRDREQGKLLGELEYNLTTKAYRGNFDTGFDPHILLPLLKKGQQTIVRRFSFNQEPPRIVVDFRGIKNKPEALVWSGTLAGTNLVYNGGHVSSFHTRAGFTNQVLSLEPLTVVREEGEVHGDLELHFREKMVRVDGKSTIHPKVLARIIGPKLARSLRALRIRGPTSIEAKGFVDYGSFRRSELYARMDAQQLGLKWFEAARCGLDLSLVGPKLVLTNMVGSLYGGRFAGTTTFEPIGQGEPIQYKVAGGVTNVNFASVVVQLRGVEGDPYQGKLTGHAAVSGFLGQARSDSAVGRGRLRISEGTLYRISLLGGLSKMLSRIFPGFGFAQQTEFSSSFDIRDRRVYSNNVKLEGNLISVSAEGNYAFDQSLDFDVKVKFLREGALAEVVQFLTTPLTKLLEFHLGGTLDQPAWSPENLPKEIFIIRE